MWRILVGSRNNQFVKTTIQNFRSLIMPSKSFVSSLLRNTKSSLILGRKKFSNPNFHDGLCFRCWMGYNFLVKHNIALPLIFFGQHSDGILLIKIQCNIMEPHWKIEQSNKVFLLQKWFPNLLLYSLYIKSLNI